MKSLLRGDFMSDHVKNPLAGFPETETRTDAHGRSTWRVSPRVLTPVGARTTDQVTAVFGLVLAAAMVYGLVRPLDSNAIDWACALLLWLAARAFVRAALREVLKVTTRTVVSGDRFKIRSGLLWKSYDLNRPHSFALVPHTMAQQEAREADYAAREAATRGKAIRKPVYFGDSYHVVFVYDGHVIYLFDVFGRAWGEAIVNRYQYITRERAAESKRKGDDTRNPHAENDWHASPGGLDDV
jgi:hypothetical protein